MEVGLAAGIRNLPGKIQPLTEAYRDFLAQGVLAEELGFSHVWLSEHHFAEDDWNSAPLPVLAALATHTERIRIGTYVLLLALHNPLRIAEDTATIDILSNGRLDLVIGAGPMQGECDVFGIEKKETFGRTYEALEFIERCYKGEKFTHKGKYYSFQNVELHPRPVQPGGPPIWMAAMGPQSIAKAAERGYHLASALHTPLWKTYSGLLEKVGRRRQDHKIASGPLIVHIADTREQAWDEAEVGAHWCVEFYRRRGMDMPLPPVGELRRTPNAGIYSVPFAIGTVDDVMRALSAYRDEPLEELGIQFQHPGVDAKITQRSMRVFAREILPEIRKWGANKAA